MPRGVYSLQRICYALLLSDDKRIARDPSMTQRTASDVRDRAEARRLIEIARAKLMGKSEEMAALYLDHALSELREIERRAPLAPSQV
ncbi:hypothetical protein Swit_0171 [Rhizorhabdus wittichii RW1]|uniref:Uncharacterized protein n=1 Tax=Rhizorhabdus wittichii (strain DSM 6014 / CCUG 31198 / JCM 15750 / NBRC 105917 / EY 4224 / RW1) TaxID=392499 RepID=A0A9J9LAS4_RHIWR|nr:hypothetical protein Swit_0171 [Rhizorhabdus wittichii RW1]